MKKRLFRSKSIKKHISYLTIITLLIPILFVGGPEAQANELRQVESIHNEKIAKEIFFQTNKTYNFPDNEGRNVTEYILKADLNEPTVEIISSKANDRVLQTNSLSNHIAREKGLGKQVVAGINGDMYNISPGTMHYGAPLGLQVQNGEIIVGFETPGSVMRYPVFIIDKNGKPLITHVKMDNRLSIIDDEYEKRHGQPNPDLSINIDTINRNNTAVMYDKMILITPKLANNPLVRFTEDQAVNGTLTILKNIQGINNNAVILGEEYEAEVISVGRTSPDFNSLALTPDMMVLASQGLKADWVQQNLRPGDKVRFTFDIKDLANNTLGVKQAVSSWLPLVKDGRALTEAQMLKICENDWDKGTATIKAKDKARTAIGYTKDKQIIALAVDGVSPASDSYGANLPGMAKRMEKLGVVAAVSLDGGGSTQVNSRLFGQEGINLMNQPADGRERSISNAILFLSNAPRTYDVAELKIDRDITIFKNNSYTFNLRGVDSNVHPVNLNKDEIKWGIVSDVSSGSLINEQGQFKASNGPEVIRVQADYGEIHGQAQVTVVDKVDSLHFTESGTIALPLHMPKTLQVQAYTADKTPIILTNKDIEWSVTPNSLAEINSYGVLIPLSQGQGLVTARLGDKETTINFIAGLESQLIDDYELKDKNAYFVDGYVGGSSAISSQQVKTGQHSLKVDYDYANWTRVYNGTINIKSKGDEKNPGYTSYIQPKKIGMWVYGDGQAPWLRAIIKDGNQDSHIINLAPRINWTGWQYVSAPIPADLPLPITLDYFYMVETDKGKNLKGTVYFDDIQFIYID